MISNQNTPLSVGRVDWGSILIYVVLVLVGWLNIYAADYKGPDTPIFDWSLSHGMQLVWIGISLFLAVSILLIDAKYYHILAYPLYWVSILILLGTLFFGKEVNGDKAWIAIGPVSFQPVELVKFTTSLILARYMSSYTFDIHRAHDLLRVGAIMGLPILIVLLQKDVGSALVFSSFLFMLFREGFNRWVYVVLILVISLFVSSFLFDPTVLLIVLLLVCVIGEGLTDGRWRDKLIYVAAIALSSVLLYMLSSLSGGSLSLHTAILISVLFSLVWVLLYAYRHKVRNFLTFVLIFLGSLAFTYSIDYLFHNILEPHQQSRILDLLGLVSDPDGSGYNVIQSKIAIGSGGFSGHGLLSGTQTKFNFVPEQHTDFIFSVLGEAWGFLGCALVVVLLGILILRLIRMGERQMEPFGRIYCYCVASIFFFHLLVNVGMTIGLMPVIGIPLPFLSYGGSSMILFTVMLFVAIRLDSAKKEFTQRL